MQLTALLDRIDKTKALINKRRPLASEEVRELDAYFRVGMTYSSNALEGNSLDLTETKILLEDGITVGGKPIRDCYEAIGHARAYDFMLEAARSDPFMFLEDTVLQLHKLFYMGIDPDKAGVYRDHQVFITGTEYLPPAAEEIPALMKVMVESLTEKWDSLHPVILSAFAHQRLVDIHPFTDGNGRSARLLMNLILINRGYQIATIPPILRREYINSIEKSRRGGSVNAEPLAAFVAGCVVEAQKDYCRMFRIELPDKDTLTR
jgi:Fic family protein